MKYFLIIFIVLAQIGCSTSAQNKEAENDLLPKVQRKPFQKSSVVIKSPETYLKRETAKGKQYDPKPQFVLVDEKSGKYELRWIGYDRKLKVIKYQRSDAIDAVVEARVERQADGKFIYRYLVKNLPGSPNDLGSFTVQTFANDLEVVKMDHVYIGDMSSDLREFNNRTWYHYAILEDTPLKVKPGGEIEFSLKSSFPPGIVGCKATTGDLTLKGVGEHMPQELENMMPGYEEWTTGYTIGPIDEIVNFTKSEKIKYLSDNLVKFQEAGWISAEASEKYKVILNQGDLSKAIKRIEKDFENGYITSEVFYVIKYLAE